MAGSDTGKFAGKCENGGRDTVDEELICAGETVILQKYNYMRTHVLNVEKNLQMGRDFVNLGGVVGHRFGQTFQMVPDPKNKKVFCLQPTEDVVDLESIFLTGEGGTDNRDLQDQQQQNQNLSRQEIEEMRDTGVSGVNIVGRLIENSETYQNKTKFSQEKFLRKKAKKYHQYVMMRKPSIRLLMDIMYKADPMKILNLRIDSLAQILNMTNVHSGGRYLVYETGAQGIVVASMLERLGGAGELVHIYQTGQPQTAALNSMGLHKSEILKVINIQHLRSLEQGRDILVNHTTGTGGDKKEPEEERTGSPSKRIKPDPTSQAVDAAATVDGAGAAVTGDTAAVDGNVTAGAVDGDTGGDTGGGDGEGGMANSQQTKDLPVRMNLREKSVATYQSIKQKPMDGLVIVCKQHPGNLLVFLSQFVAPSRPFAVYSPYKEPLLETYMQVKEDGLAVMCTVSETWLRNHQVLPQRTHPTVTMSGGGGYLLTGTFVEK